MDHHHHHLPHLLGHLRLPITRLAIDAQAKGPGWGIFVGDPDEMGAETPEEVAALEAARTKGAFLGLMRHEDLVRMLPASQAREVVLDRTRRLLAPPPAGSVHALAVLGHELATFDVPVPPIEWVVEEEREEARIGRIEDLLGLATPIARRRAAEGIPPGSIFIAEPEGGGVRVAIRSAAEALEILPLDDVHDDGPAVRRLLQPAPAGSMKIAVVFGGGFSVATLPIAAE
jgi:hypothetical protein